MGPKDNQILIKGEALGQYGACEPCSDKILLTKSLNCDSVNKNHIDNNHTLTLSCDHQIDSTTNHNKQPIAHFEQHLIFASSTTSSPEKKDDELEKNDQDSECESTKPEEESFLQRMAKTIPCLGIIFALLASLFLGSAGMLVKMTSSIHGIQVAVFRSIVQLAIYGLWITFRGGDFLPKRDELFPVMGRAFLGASSITCSYYALKLIPLGDATTIRFSLPIWTLIISYLVLNESCDIFKVAAVVVSISGVVLIAKPDDCIYLMHKLLFAFQMESSEEFELNYKQYQLIKSDFIPRFDPEAGDIQLERYDNLIASRAGPEQSLFGPVAAVEVEDEELLMRVGSATSEQPSSEPINHLQLEGCLLALSSSICLSLSLVALRLCKKTPAEVTILWLSIISIAIGSISLLSMNRWSLPDSWLDVAFILLNGVCGSIGQWFITSALKIEQSGVISLARTFDIEVAFLYSAFVLHEHIRATSIIGSVLVSLGVVAVLVPRWLDSRKNSWLRRRQTTVSLTAAMENANQTIEDGQQQYAGGDRNSCDSLPNEKRLSNNNNKN